ncbi:hypothetical protein MTO96_037908 [Rhipicephalus appendiculatus]
MKEAMLYYADNNCGIIEVEYSGQQCMLWVKRYLKDKVPQACIDSFVDICGVVVTPGRRDLCVDGEGDY